MIVIEGCDGTGKTTLAQSLASLYSYDYVHESVPKEKSNFEYYLKRALELPVNSVLDRFHLGEVVYPAVKKDGRVPLEGWEVRMIDRVLSARGTLLIHADPSLETVLETIDTRGDWYIDEVEAVQVYHAFKLAQNLSILPSLRYSWQDKHDSNLAFNLDIERELQVKANDLAKYSGCGEIHRPKVVLVGDRFADGTWAQAGKQAFTAPGNSSAYLHQALSRIDDMKRERYHAGAKFQCYITNAHKFESLGESAEAFMSEWMLLTCNEQGPVLPQIVALGKEASEFLTTWGWDHNTVPHPQYWRRFRHKELEQYAHEIAAAGDVI